MIHINIPLWFLITFSQVMAKTHKRDNHIMREIEKHILSYSVSGKSNPIYKTRLPFYLTPEAFSVIFHFMGDGHIGRYAEETSSYKQLNSLGLYKFLLKLKNTFGCFNYSKGEYSAGRLNIPKIISNFYIHYFKLPNTDTFGSYLPKHLKQYPKKFLLAGLAAFIVDEGNINDVITIYSKNKRLIKDIREIGLKCGYICHQVREKYTRGKFDCYRFNISVYSFPKLYDDLKKLSSEFPTCDFAQKQTKFLSKIH